MKRWFWFVAFLFLLVLSCLDRFYYRPRMDRIQKEIYVFDCNNSEQFTRWKQIVEILTTDLYRQRIISWDADMKLKELDRATMEGR